MSCDWIFIRFFKFRICFFLTPKIVYYKLTCCHAFAILCSWIRVRKLIRREINDVKRKNCTKQSAKNHRNDSTTWLVSENSLCPWLSCTYLKEVNKLCDTKLKPLQRSIHFSIFFFTFVQLLKRKEHFILFHFRSDDTLTQLQKCFPLPSNKQTKQTIKYDSLDW